jgi:hypothetical protein
MFEDFSFRLAFGLLLSLLFLPPQHVHARFFRIQFVIALGLLAAGGVLGWDHLGDLAPLGLGLAGGACLVGSWAWSDDDPLVGQICVAASGLALAFTLYSLKTSLASQRWYELSHVLASGALLGFATTAMLIGHWYLIALGMSMQPIRQQIVGLFTATAVRAGLDLLDLVGWMHQPWDATAWIWLASRWGICIAALSVLNVMALQTVRIRATQSATGILYVVTIFAYLGELTALLLKQHFHLA